MSNMVAKDPRLSQVLPIIRCSDCGQDVEFRRLSEHACIAVPQMPVLPLYLNKPATDDTPTTTTTKSGSALDSLNHQNDTSKSTLQPRTSAIPVPSPSKTSSVNTSPLSPIRSASSAGRPSLPFLEKYSKRKSASAPALLSHPIHQAGLQRNNSLNRNGQQHQMISPIVAAVLSYGEGESSSTAPSQQLQQRRVLDYAAPRASLDERLSVLRQRYAPEATTTTTPTMTKSRSQESLMETTICNYPGRVSRTMSQQLPIIPRKSAARTSAIAPRRGLGITTGQSNSTATTTGQPIGTNLASSDSRTEFGRDQERQREWEKSNRSATTIRATTPNQSLLTSTAQPRLAARNSTQLERSNVNLSERTERPSMQAERPERIERYFQPEIHQYPSDLLPMERQYRPERDSQQIFSPSTTPRGDLSPYNGVSAYSTTPSPPLSPLDERKDLNLAQETRRTAYTPPTPPQSSSPSPVPSKEHSVRGSSEVRRSTDTRRSSIVSSSSSDIRREIQTPPVKANVDHFDALMEDLMLEIKEQPRVSPRIPPRPPRPQTGTVKTEYQRVNSPLPSKAVSTATPATTVRRVDGFRINPSAATAAVAPGQEKVLCFADDRKPVQGKIPVLRADETKGPTTAIQTRTTATGRRASPIPAPRPPVRSAEDTRVAPVSGTVPPIQSRTVRGAQSPTPAVPAKAVRQTEVVRTSPASPPPLKPRPSRQNEVLMTPVSPPLQPRVIRQTEVIRTTASPTPQPRATRQKEILRTPPSPPLQPKAVRQTEAVRRAVSPPPIQTRAFRQTETIKSPSSPAPLQQRPPARRADDLRRAVSPPPVQSRPTRRLDDVQSAPLRPQSPPVQSSRIARRSDDVQSAPLRPQSPPVQSSRIARRSDEMRTAPLPIPVQPKNVRRSEDTRNPSPPGPEAPKVARRSDDLRHQRSAAKHEDEKVEQQRRPDRGFRSERIEMPPRQHSDRSSGGSEQSFEHDHDHDHEHERKPIRTDKKQRERSLTRSASAAPATAVTRSRSTNGRGGFERCADCKHDILPSEQADSHKLAYGSYHYECLKCSKCRKTLESSLDAHEYEGRLLCERDFALLLEQEVLRPQRRRACAGCEAPILPTERTVWALEKPWHEHHLCCYHCLKPIRDAGTHMEKNGRVYCARDYSELFLPKCNACGLTVETGAVSAQDGKLKGKWHASCFRCQTCRRPFPDKKFYVFEQKPYCRRHYHRLNNSMCTRCDEPIEGACAQTMEGWRFHTKCFCCSECGIKLKESYYSYDEQTYCEKDMLRIQRTRNLPRTQRCQTIYGDI